MARSRAHSHTSTWHWHSTFQSASTRYETNHILCVSDLKIGTHFKIAIELKAIDVSVCGGLRERIQRATFTNDESPFGRHVKSNNKCFREGERAAFIIVIIYLSIYRLCHVLLCSAGCCYMMLKDQRSPGGCSPSHLWDTVIKPKQIIPHTTDNTSDSVRQQIASTSTHRNPCRNTQHSAVCILR